MPALRLSCLSVRHRRMMMTKQIPMKSWISKRENRTTRMSRIFLKTLPLRLATLTRPIKVLSPSNLVVDSWGPAKSVIPGANHLQLDPHRAWACHLSKMRPIISLAIGFMNGPAKSRKCRPLRSQTRQQEMRSKQFRRAMMPSRSSRSVALQIHMLSVRSRQHEPRAYGGSAR